MQVTYDTHIERARWYHYLILLWRIFTWHDKRKNRLNIVALQRIRYDFINSNLGKFLVNAFTTERKVVKMKSANPKWTLPEVDKVVGMYDGGKGMSVVDIAEAQGRTEKSVQGQLTHKGVYVKAEKPVAHPKDDGPSKADIMARIEETGFDMEGGSGANKAFLQRLLDSRSTDLTGLD